jgi:hypothetical protein
MDKFLEKHRKAVLLVVDELSKKISDSFQIDRTELNKLV